MKEPSSKNRDDDDDLFNQVLSGSTNIHESGGMSDIFDVKGTVHDENAIDFEDIDELADDEELPEEEISSKAVASRNANAALDAATLAVGELDSDAEEAIQQQADADFDDIFGNDDPMNDNLLDLQNTVPEEEQLDFGGVYEDEETQQDQIDADQQRDLDLKKKEKEQQIAMKKAKMQKIINKLQQKRDKYYLSKYFPSYSPDKPYNNQLLFLLAPKYYGFQRPLIAQKSSIKPLIPTKITLDLARDQKKIFCAKRDSKLAKNSSSCNSGNVVNIVPQDFSIIEQLQNGKLNIQSQMIPFLQSDNSNNAFQNLPKDLIFSTTSWDDDAIINAGEPPKPPPQAIQPKEFDELDDDSDNDIFNGQISHKLTLDMNDPKLLLAPGRQQKKNLSCPLQRFNISNDKDYEILTKNYNTKVRQQVSNLHIDHSVPAARLQSPYFKVKLSQKECRSFHRPKFLVRPGAVMTFNKLKVRKKKKDKGKSVQEIFAKTGDLTIADTAPIVGMEYSEQYPQILSNFGMASKIINYYRKEREDDYTRPKAPFGETHVLGVEDKSPFWNFGHVEKGDFVPTLYNNMIRAPIFKHDVKQTDFLLIRSQGAGSHTKHFLRPLSNVYAVGQLFSAVEVPAPHSRKITNTSKNRLKVIVYRTMNKTGEARISVKDISHHFPDQNDMQNRQRLKEFMEYQRQGEDQGYWKMKFLDHVPTEEEIRQMITPEDLCLLDSMQHHQQMLEDFLGIMTGEKTQEDKLRMEREEKERRELEKKGHDGVPIKRERRNREVLQEDIEEELCSWNTSRNFLSANQTKATLQLNGDGDPSGVGIGFSFLRATQKCTFSPLFGKEPDGPRTAAQSQKIYEDEISRIWYAQRRSLTVDKHSGHDLKSIYNEYPPHKYPPLKEFDALDGHVLKITRRFRDENNVVQRRVVTIKDPVLIRAYTKKKQMIEDELLRNAEVDDIIPTNDKELNKLRRKALEEKLASLEKRAKSNRGKKVVGGSGAYGSGTESVGQNLPNSGVSVPTVIDANTIKLPDGSVALGGKGIGKGKSKTRRCAACGALGHIRTRKTCPLFNQQKLQGVDDKTESKEQDDVQLQPMMPPLL